MLVKVVKDTHFCCKKQTLPIQSEVPWLEVIFPLTCPVLGDFCQLSKFIKAISRQNITCYLLSINTTSIIFYHDVFTLNLPTRKNNLQLLDVDSWGYSPS